MRSAAALLLAGLAASLAMFPAAAWPHGGEEEALEKTPARALAQQALALLAQEDKAVEAHERIQAALRSKDREGVDFARLREVRSAFDRGDHSAARKLLNRALAPMSEESPAHGEPADAGKGGAGPATGDEGALLEHAPQYEPDRGGAEWVAAGVGGGMLLVGTALLIGRRRPRRG